MSHLLSLLAPFDGLVVPLEKVDDPVFAGLMMGDGLAIEPLSATLRSPCSGKITQLSRTGHALTLTADEGVQILIHIGIDTVKLQGEGFYPLISEGQTVKAGDPLIDVDFDFVASKAPSLHTMMIVVNADDFKIANKAVGRVKAGESSFYQVLARSEISSSNTAAHLASESSAALTQETVGQHSKKTIVRHAGGLHARPSAMVQNVSKQYHSKVTIELDEPGTNAKSANAKSVVSLMSLGVGQDQEVWVHAHGIDALEALTAVVAALQTYSEDEPIAQSDSEAGSDANLLAGQIPGVVAAPGLVVGPLLQWRVLDAELPLYGVGVDIEYDRLYSALAKVREDIQKEINDADKSDSVAVEGIFTAHLALLDDPEILLATEAYIVSELGAGEAFRRVIRKQCDVLKGLGNTLLAQRVSDLLDLERRILAEMGYVAANLPQITTPSILVSEDLAPSELTRLDRKLILGLAMSSGGATSHVAILARAMGIPALVALGSSVLKLKSGTEVILDANAAFLDTQASEDRFVAAKTLIQQHLDRLTKLRALAFTPAHTQDGLPIEVSANIANEKDAHEAMQQGADAVGLLRTEFLFINRQYMPTEDEQNEAYQAVLDALQGRYVIIRTMDVGGDKEVPYLPLPLEANPALGLRGIRMGMAKPQLIKTQLRALMHLQPLANLRILLPMISEVAEIIQIKAMIEEIAQELNLQERPQLGAMIEVPSAALLADQLAQYVDFFSIGTNDLTQYTLAMDRGHAGLSARVDPMHPSILRLIKMTCEGAKLHGKWVGMCGGMASDLEAVPVLIGLGVTELSVSAPLIPEVKALIRKLSYQGCQANVDALLQLESAPLVRAAARKLWPQDY